ncbi:MAG: T9SS type A sorting domain-containing protein [Sphingobacteriales bacterium]|nr:T9SS type A sorting domain-containing protein [Sphingobacteriales bacterium]
MYSENKFAYTFDDTKADYGDTYYRVKVVLSNGKFYYSGTVKLKQGGNNWTMNIFPNPAVSNTILNITTAKAENIDVTIYNISGSKVYQQSKYVPAGIHSLIIPSEHYAPGMYYVVAKTLSGSFTKSFLKN